MIPGFVILKSALVLALLAATAGPPLAHDLRYEVTQGNAVVVTFFSAGDTRFSYEVYPPGEEAPFQVGRTDERGRLAFVPDRAGGWRVKAFSEDGHGVDFVLETDEHRILSGTERPLFERQARLFVGLALIFGVFGLISLTYRRKRQGNIG